MRRLAVVLLAALAAPPLVGQTPARDPSATLQQVLPADVAAEVLRHIAEARSRELPAAALEHRALELAAKGVEPAAIERSIAAQAAAMDAGRRALQAGGRARPTDDEVAAAGAALGKGVDGAAVSELAKSAPSGRSLVVPLFVIASLADRGLPSDDALARVLARLQARASDAELEKLPDQAAEGQAHRPEQPGRPVAAGRPEGAGASGSAPPASAPPPAVPVAGPPASVPANGGGGLRPTPPGKPATPVHPSGRP